MPPSRRSRPTLPPSLEFEAIGTRWQVDSAEALEPELVLAMHERIARFDATWSRFRDDSLVRRIAREPGSWRLPADAPPLLDLYRRLYVATDGAVSPLVGRSLEVLGYDAAYSLRPSGPARPAPAWEDAVRWDGSTLTAVRPVMIDIGAAGKGYLVDLVGELLVAGGATGVVVDASGDLRRWDAAPGYRVALEHPADPTKAIGVIELGGRAICASATNRRAWGNGLHHVLDATTGLPTSRVIATWAIAPTALVADGCATALFFADADRIAEEFGVQFVRVHSTGRVEFSPDLDGEMFL
ncbi:FAD:protein FMN transferase [Salinibacterium soli]|uniref:FAD:protein FMN transferase n=1 Tax=Antiquaquibacter soli TaxID=3064523 RepID=A0ABT9BRQ7_9MICO|nr:FAD:protein FMN transferase [Protaetiibacter sp. WY-16]MDO7883695.1 FAD:protein FMN transferase [Protaetiibacter sp. WY-16]